MDGEQENPLRRARKAKGLTQDQLAEKSRVGQATISELEQGDKSPTLAVAMRLAEALDASITDLFLVGDPT